VPYPKHIEQKLEFDQIKQLLLKKCISEMGEKYVDNIRFVNRFDILERLLLQVKEFKTILLEDTPFPAEHYYNIEAYLKKAAIEGAFLSEEEFHQLRLLLNTVQQICKYFELRNEKYPQLAALFGGIQVNKNLINSIEKILNDKGEMRPNASPDLAKISSKLSEKEKEVRRRLNSLFEKANSQGWLADSGITIRDGRLVLPILAEHKRKIPGLVNDESATGQTVYIEPTEVFEINNSIREYQIAFKRERERILIALTHTIRPFLPELNTYLQRIGLIDFIRAKALLAIDLGAEMPIILKQAQAKWIDAYHPLLKLNHQKSGLPIVPLSAELSKEKRILVISGPNAGGKSVCLKTIGLLQYMFQCGFLVPCKSHSEIGLFADMLVDIGDEQSIENDLSTYSSHLVHMKYFTEFADAKTLFLIDEFGTGTDPQFGGPLAESILNRLNQKQAFGVVTTHYSNLKNFAANTTGMQNACMLFDNSKMQPLYVLEIGKPGSSYAFEIAQKIGLSTQVINYAKTKVGDKQKRVDDLLIDLEKEKSHVYELKKRYAEKEEKSTQLIEEYTKLKTELDTNRKKLLTEARQEALSIISEANSRIENTIREIREKKADTETIRKVRIDIKQEVDGLKNKTKTDTPKPIQQTILTTHHAVIEKGMHVHIIGQNNIGEVVELKQNKALIAFGDLHSWVDIQKLNSVQNSKKEIPKQPLKGVNINNKLLSFESELNLIGMRGEDAIRELQQYIDDAYLIGFKEVRIVHGRGYGILKKLVKQYLQKSSFVESMRHEPMELGGDGVSIVMLKS
jgi:DNA mismatch repair protein MutS2